MAIIDKNYYTDVFFGVDMTDEEFSRFSTRAEEVANALTFGRLEKAPAEIRESDSIKKAICAETELLFALGEDSYTKGSQTRITREEIGSVAVSYSKNGIATFKGIPLSGLMIMMLENTGLLFKGV